MTTWTKENPHDTSGFLLQESASYLLLESGYKIILQESWEKIDPTSTDWIKQNPH